MDMLEIIDHIKRDRISTTEIADCLGKTGALDNMHPINRSKFAVGPVKWVYGYNDSNWEVHEQLRDTEKGEVVLVEMFNTGHRAVFGSLVSKYTILYKQAAGMVVIGYLRDIHTLIKEDYPLWAQGVTPIGCYNTKNKRPFDRDIIEDRRKKYNGAIAVCDDSGVVIIPPDHINEEFYHKLDQIEEQEDMWFDCIDRKKWDTYDTVCLKKYLTKSK